MTDCAQALAMIEKLSDGEASDAEKIAAEAHLEKCPSCRSHLEFLASLDREARSLSFPEPPPSYWEHLPRRVLTRIESESARPSRIRRLLSPPMLPWAALGATLLVLATLSVSVLLNDPRTPAAPPAPSPAPLAETPRATAQVAAEPEDSPQMARDEAAPEVATTPAAGPDAGEPTRTPAEPEAPAPPAASAEKVATFSASEAEETNLQRENVQGLESAARARPAAAPPAALSRAVLDDCEALRRAAASVGDAPEVSDARFRLAMCSLDRHGREPTDELRIRAIEDADAFLAGEVEGERAKEIRERLRRLRPE